MNFKDELAQHGVVTTRQAALSLDAADPLAAYPSQFVVADPELCYLDGNSLGRMPKATAAAIADFLTNEWAAELVDGWAHWIDEAQTVGDLLGRSALGAGAGQILVQDTTSVNFYQLCVAAVNARPGRKTVIIDSSNFPTDRYILAGIAESMGLTLVTLNNDGTAGPGAVDVVTIKERITPEVLRPLLNDDVALVALQAIHYRSGSRPDILGITDLVREFGGLVVWDCSHATGLVNLQLDAWGVDLAVGCTYKYGNSGPGSPGWLYVNSRIQNQLQVPIQGWFAQDNQFEMGPYFEPTDGIRRFQIATPPVIGLRSVKTSFDIIAAAGISNIEHKGALGTELIIALFDAWLEPLGFDLLTPRDAALRGGHVTVTHPDAKLIATAMRKMSKVVPDFRQPNGIRLAMSPLTNTYVDIWDGLDRMRALVESGEYLNVQDDGGRVT